MQVNPTALVLILTTLTLLSACSSSLPEPPKMPGQENQAPPGPPGSDDYANPSFPSPLAVSDARDILIRTNTFAVSFNAYNVFPRQLQAFNVLLDQPNAVDLFADVANRSGRAGRLYALCALTLLDKRRAQELAHQLDLSTEHVRTISGDLYVSEQVRVLATQIMQTGTGSKMRKVRNRVYASFSPAG